ADEFAGLDAIGHELVLLGGCNEFVVEQDVAHGTHFATRTAGHVVRLAFFRSMNALPAFGDVVHYRNGRPLKLVSQAEILRQRITSAERVNLAGQRPRRLPRFRILKWLTHPDS